MSENRGRGAWLRAVGLLLALWLGVAWAMPAVATPVPEGTPVVIDDAEVLYQPEEVALAWGDLAGPQVAYAWPFALESIGHTIASYQYYGGSPYFHHGLDIMAPAGTQVYNRSGGQVVNIENYQPGNSLYWEVAILDPEGYLWQYHHINQSTIPQYIWNKYYEYLADPVNGGFIPPDTHIGNIVTWPVGYPGAPSNFHHIHLNILGANGYYLNGFAFHTPLLDTAPPVILAIGLLKNGAVYPGNQVSGEYGLYVRSRDLILAPNWYWVPPHEIKFSVDREPGITVWRFDELPGGGDRYAYVADFYVVPPTCGDYECNDFYIDLGFTKQGQRPFPTEPGLHRVTVKVRDYAGNLASGTFTWTVLASASSHVGDLDGASAFQANGKWKAQAAIIVHDQYHARLAGATVAGHWEGSAPGSATCTTNTNGKCAVVQNGINPLQPSITFTVDSVTKTGYPYAPANNHDPDGDSDGTAITVSRP